MGGTLVGRLDLARIGLMGHSRGGEGVVAALEVNRERPPAERHAIRAVFSIAPVDFTTSAAGDVAFGTLLPSCDGDVWSLSGARIFDRSRYLEETSPAPKVQVLALGANHNYYNTAWASETTGEGRPSGDDARWMTDPHCSKGEETLRFSPEDQARHGLVFTAAFLRAYAGGETAFTSLFTGVGPFTDAVCPTAAEAPPCRSLFHVSYHPPPGDRLVVENLESEDTDMNALGGGNRFEGFSEVSVCRPRECPTQFNTGAGVQMTLAWEGPATWTAEIPAPHGDVGAFDAVALRIGVNFDEAANPWGGAQDFRVRLTDAGGRSGDVLAGEHSEAFFFPPGSVPPEERDRTGPQVLDVISPRVCCNSNAKVTLNQVRIPLDAFEGVDLTRIRGVSLVFDATPSGSVQVADLMFLRV